eukprot:TRINITY_DN248_c0_g1_i2.p1 TRINITY_DN248_c0_g1~~TRINITY_DN248_c0_g1_i2.p1  ORF type:complete len:606 (-),score=69.42 TRINITY_DN248_c0_g1_i2:104-1921(-)
MRGLWCSIFIPCILSSSYASSIYEPEHSHPSPYSSAYEPTHPDYEPTPDYAPEEEEESYYIPPEQSHLKETYYAVQHPIIPSKSPYTGYVHPEIIRFREMFRGLRMRYPGAPLLTKYDLLAGHTEYPQSGGDHGREGYVLGNFLNNVLTSLGITGWPLNPYSLNPMNALVTNTQSQVDVNVDLSQTGSIVDSILGGNTGNNRALLRGIEPCSNNNGVCEGLSTCLADGGISDGTCSNCVSCATCCKYEYEDITTTNKPIFFFQSPGYPTTRRDATSISVSLEIRANVTQILVEFEDFELPINPATGCLPTDYFEILSPSDPDGIIGPNNNRFCGLNSGQHFYIRVAEGDLVIFRVVTSGVGFVPLAVPGAPATTVGDNAWKFQVKVTQIFTGAPTISVTKRYKRDTGIVRYTNTIIGQIPDYYRRLAAPSGCHQYFTSTSGVIESLNFDGRSDFADNQNYAICFRTPQNSCGMSLQALRFGIATSDQRCVSGERALGRQAGLCCTETAVDAGKVGFNKFIGFDATTVGVKPPAGTPPLPSQPRYFFCGNNLGSTSGFLVSSRKGPLRLNVFSDGIDAATANPASVQRTNNIGFRLRYEVNTGTCV